MAEIRLSNNVQIPQANEATILSSAELVGVTLEHSCRTGRCGVCKAQVISGTTEIMSPELSLSAEEVSCGLILTCCRSAATDVQLDIEDLGGFPSLQPKTLPARIDTIERLSSDVIGVTLRIPPASKLDYRAGQYIDVIGSGGVRRSYSLANAPRDDGKLRLEIRKVDGGVLSQYWFGTATSNDLLRIEGPLGTFSIRSKPSKNLIFLATGTGIAPVKAMLEELENSDESIRFEHIYLYWGGRHPNDLYWKPEFSTLSVTFVPVLSREPNWGGRVGYVQDAVLSDNLDLSDAVVYACGSEYMIASARSSLVSSGLSAKSFYSDAFVSSS